MSHNEIVSKVGGWGAFLASVVLVVGLITYGWSIVGTSPWGADASFTLALGGAFLVSVGAYHLLARLALQGPHRRPNAEVALVVSIFGLLLLAHLGLGPSPALTLSPPMLAVGVVVLVGTLVASSVYLANPTWLER